MKRSYCTDLTDAQWECLEFHIPPPNKRGRPKTHSSREILNAIFYVLKSGCAWRLLPRHFPPWETVYWWFRRWRINGTFERLNATLRERLRVRLRRNPQPSAGIVDSQSAKTTGVGGEARGYDGGKKVRGRKRHLLVDTEGLVLKAKGHSAKVPDEDGIKLLLKGVRDRLPHLFSPVGGCRVPGPGQALGGRGARPERWGRSSHSQADARKVAMMWAEEWSKESVKIDWQKLIPRRGFEILPRRWVVERTFSWLSQNRRMSKDYERLCATAEAFVYVAMTRLMVRRLARA
jgi:putative transposase